MIAAPLQTASCPLGERSPVRVRYAPEGLLIQQLARSIAQDLSRAITERGFAVLAVSGGKSPIPLFECLRQEPIAWQHVRVTLVDERCVPTSHPDSNARLVREHLLQGPARAAQWVPMVLQDHGPLPPLAEIAHTAGLALKAAGLADVVLLGMGADGHTASLFPAAPNLAQALDAANPVPCLPIELTEPPANAPYPRLTQTLSQLLSARQLVLPLQGQDKLATLALAYGALSAQLPISYLLHQQQTHTPLTIWLEQPKSETH